MAKFDVSKLSSDQIQLLLALAGSLNQSAQPTGKTARPVKNDRLATKDQAILRGFARKGIKDVVLMDRSDRSKPFNVKPFKAWMAEGRVVQKGQHGVKGLFHISQTEALPQAEKDQPKADTVKASQAEISRLATKFRLAKDRQPTA